MFSIATKIEKKDGEIIEKAIKDGNKYLDLQLTPPNFGISFNVHFLIRSIHDISNTKKIEIYVIYHDVITWDCEIMFLIINKAKYNLTKKVEFLMEKPNEKISREEYQRRFLNNKSFLNLISNNV